MHLRDDAAHWRRRFEEACRVLGLTRDQARIVAHVSVYDSVRSALPDVPIERTHGSCRGDIYVARRYRDVR